MSSSGGLQNLAPGVGRVTILGLPITGLMGEQPALTIGGIIGFGAFVVAALVAFLGWTMPPEWWVFFDTWGVKIAGALIIGIPIIQSWWTRSRVVSPRTAAKLADAPIAKVPQS